MSQNKTESCIPVVAIMQHPGINSDLSNIALCGHKSLHCTSSQFISNNDRHSCKQDGAHKCVTFASKNDYDDFEALKGKNKGRQITAISPAGEPSVTSFTTANQHDNKL